jgi:hypothetical protein
VDQRRNGIATTATVSVPRSTLGALSARRIPPFPLLVPQRNVPFEVQVRSSPGRGNVVFAPAGWFHNWSSEFHLEQNLDGSS